MEMWILCVICFFVGFNWGKAVKKRACTRSLPFRRQTADSRRRILRGGKREKLTENEKQEKVLELRRAEKELQRFLNYDGRELE